MKLLITYIPFQILLGVLLGILFPVLNIYIICVLPFVILGMMFLLHRYVMSKNFTHQIFFLLLLFFGMSLSWFSQTIQNDLLKQNHYTRFLNKEVIAKITLVKQLTTTKTYQRFYAEVNTLNDTVSTGKILIEIPVKNIKKSDVKLGNILVCKTNFKTINPPTSPYDFDYKAYLVRQHVYAKIKLEYNYIKIGEDTSWFIQLQKLRNSTSQVLEKSSLSTDTVGLLKAMLLGDKNGVTEEMRTSFTNSGVVHIIAISGMHVGVLYFMLLFTFGFVKRFRYGNYIYVTLVLLGLWSFAVFSGLSSSVIRSVTMFSFFILTKLKKGLRLGLEAVVTSMLVLLLADAHYLFDVGFQLSYAAVISIIVFYPMFSKWVEIKNKIAKYFTDVLAISVIAQLGVLPLLLFYFHQMPLHFLLANFFAVSLLPIVLYGGLVVLIKLFFVLTNSFVEIIYDYLITFYLEVIHYFSSFSNLIVKDISFSKIDLLCYYIFLFCVWYVVDSFSVKRIKQSLGLIIICQLIFLFDVCKQKNASELLIYNSYAQNIITIRNNKELTVLGKDSLTFKDSVLLKANQLKNNVAQFNCDKNEVFSFKKERYLVVDKNKPYDLLTQKGMNLIINNNPKINMERLIIKLQPKQVIITGFNYKSNQLKWKNTCKKLQVSFYCVTALGAYKKN